MKFGLALSVQHRPDDAQAVRFREHVEQVRLARAVGFDSSDPFTYFQPIPTLARLAAEADGMWLGTGCLLLPLHHPVEVAEQLATLDVICGGRLIFGVGLGYRDVENEAMGLHPQDRVGRLVEGLEVIERLWTGEPVAYTGRHFTLKDVRISMPTLQRPRPPIWLAANSDAGVRRAARLGDAWLMNPHSTQATLERQLALLKDTRRALGRPPLGEVPAIKECYVAPGESFALDFAALARDRFLIGEAEGVADEIARYRERLGVTTLIVRLQWPGLEQERVLRAIRTLGERVFPRVR